MCLSWLWRPRAGWRGTWASVPRVVTAALGPCAVSWVLPGARAEAQQEWAALGTSVLLFVHRRALAGTGEA